MINTVDRVPGEADEPDYITRGVEVVFSRDVVEKLFDWSNPVLIRFRGDQFEMIDASDHFYCEPK